MQKTNCFQYKEKMSWEMRPKDYGLAAISYFNSFSASVAAVRRG